MKLALFALVPILALLLGTTGCRMTTTAYPTAPAFVSVDSSVQAPGSVDVELSVPSATVSAPPAAPVANDWGMLNWSTNTTWIRTH